MMKMLMIKRDEGGVEGNSQADGHPHDIAFYRPMGLAEGFADTSDRADKTDRGVWPR